MVRHILLHLALLDSCAAWVTISQSRFGTPLSNIQRQLNGSGLPMNTPVQQTLGYMWTMPTDPRSQHGLGGGITWAWDPQLCESLLPGFKEDFFFIEFVTCHELKAAMHRGFQSWSANNARINFVDVTEECAKLGLLNSDCPLAELWVTAINPSSSADGASHGLTATQSLTMGESVTLGEAETVGLAQGSSAGLSAALAHPVGQLTQSFVYTNGKATMGTVVETYKAVISFNTGLCWYLDSTFCSFFHHLKQILPLNADEVLWCGRGVIFLIWIVPFLFILFQVVVMVRHQMRHVGSRSEKFRAGLDVLSHQSSWWLGVKMVFLIAPPIFYMQIFMPCWDCYDFEAAATHEVGHVLGLSHPDAVNTSLCTGAAYCANTPGSNVYHRGLAAGGRLDDSTCMDPWADVVEGTPPGTPAGEVRDSIMKALTQHNPGVCLSQDDLEALNVLYPDCSHSISVPVCYKIRHNIGWVRLGVYILTPVICALAVVLLLATYLRAHQNRKIKIMHQLARAKSRDLRDERERGDELQAAHGALRDELQEHKQTEHVRAAFSSLLQPSPTLARLRPPSLTFARLLRPSAAFARR